VRQVGCYPKDLSNAVNRCPVVHIDYGQLTVHAMLYERWQSGQSYLRVWVRLRKASFVVGADVMIASLEAAPARGQLRDRDLSTAAVGVLLSTGCSGAGCSCQWLSVWTGS
jgi:hypothetical protein